VNRKIYKIYIGKPGSAKLLERHNCDKIILNFILKQWDLKVTLEDKGFDSGPHFYKHKKKRS